VSSKVKREPTPDPAALRGERWEGDPLPRGRHKLSAEAVRTSQRHRLIRAMLETVAERGYDASTVPEVVARARVSRNAFYELFTDKADCFLAACDEEAADLLGTVVSFALQPSWLMAMREGTRAYLQWWTQRPGFARAYFIGLPAVGERAIAQRERAYDGFTEMFAAMARRARIEQPALPELNRTVPRILVLAITELVAQEVRAGRTSRLPELEDDLVFIAVKLLADGREAERASA
jgi:AcrR family transcriptional regulator